MATEGRPDDEAHRSGRPWRCTQCGFYLATIYGRIFETPRGQRGLPGGVRGNLPAVIVCPNCKARNVRV